MHQGTPSPLVILSRFIGSVFAGVYFLHCAQTPQDFHWIDFPNLIFHEAGHVIFMFFGDFIHIAMGSGTQILLPLLIAIYFFFLRQYISGAVCLMWCGENFVNVSNYAGDAIVMQLPLLGGDGVIHDWNYLLSAAHVLRYTYVIANALDRAGWLLICTGILIACIVSGYDYYRSYALQDSDLTKIVA